MILADINDPTVEITLNTEIENQGTITVTAADLETDIYKYGFMYSINESIFLSGYGEFNSEINSAVITDNGSFDIYGYAEDENGNSIQSESINLLISNPDIDRNGSVDLMDLVITAQNYGKTKDMIDYDNMPDVSCDGVVNIFDLVNIAFHQETN